MLAACLSGVLGADVEAQPVASSIAIDE